SGRFGGRMAIERRGGSGAGGCPRKRRGITLKFYGFGTARGGGFAAGFAGGRECAGLVVAGRPPLSDLDPANLFGTSGTEQRFGLSGSGIRDRWAGGEGFRKRGRKRSFVRVRRGGRRKHLNADSERRLGTTTRGQHAQRRGDRAG